MDGLLLRLGLGILFSGLIAWAAYHRGSLSPSGVLGAMILGTVVFGFGGWVCGVLLVAFFVLSSLLSHYQNSTKQHLSEKFEKGHRRDLGQTLANGGAGALMAVVFYGYPDPVVLAAYVGAIATVNADTWATELGVLAKAPPRSLITWRQVEPGTSGGISVPGTLACIAGALVIGLTAAVCLAIDGDSESLHFILPAVCGGVAGCMVDSFLGATVQAIYYSPERQKETEKAVEANGTRNVHQRGWRWLNNDWVNFIGSLAGTAVAVGVWLILA